MKILLVDDHRLVADALQTLLVNSEPGVSVTTCYSAQHAFSYIEKKTHFDLVMTDLYMPGIDGIGLIRGMRNRGCHTATLVLSSGNDELEIQRVVEASASGYLAKSLPAAEMLTAIRTIRSGGTYFPGGYRSKPCMFRSTSRLGRNTTNTKSMNLGNKQHQVLELIALGNSNKQISQIVGISEATVKYHTSQLFKLMDVKNRTSCVREAERLGLIQLQSMINTNVQVAMP